VCISWLVLLTISFLSIPTNAAAQLPSDWSSRDIGSVGTSGAASSGGGGFYVRGSGADIWGTADAFHYAYRTLTGDGEIIALVNSVDYLDPWSKAGVMMRESLSASARHAFMLVSAGKGGGFQRRPSAGGDSRHSAAGGGPGYFVRVTRSGNNFDGYISTDGANWNWVGGEYIDMPATIYVGLGVTSHYYGALTGAVFSNVNVQSWGGSIAPSGTLPSGWASGDVGAVAASGWADSSGNNISLGGSGADIWDYSDEFRFAYRTLTGDGSIVARVNSVDYYDAWSKGGVMMRDSLSPNSAHAFMLASAGNGLAFQRRSAAGGWSSHTGAGGGPGYYVKLARSGNSFNAYASADGSNWTYVGGEYIAMGSTIYVGVAVTSHADGAVAGASFSSVSVEESAVPVTQPPPAPAPPSGGASFRMLQWNVRHGGTGTDGVKDPWRLASWIAYMNPDVMSLNEVDGDWDLDPIVAALQALTGVRWYSSFSGLGNVIISRHAFSQASVCNYNSWYPRNAAHGGVVFGGRTINFFSAHLDSSSGGVRLSEVYALQGCAAAWGSASIIAGDFNMQAYTSEYAAAAYGYNDTWLNAVNLGTAYNYSGNCDGCTRNSRIDYVFSTPWYVRVTSAQLVDTRDGNGYMPSDHKPLLITFAVE
jgi:endonuclease/exonuclease/phosphatase family metal-dependent hydrolase